MNWWFLLIIPENKNPNPQVQELVEEWELLNYLLLLLWFLLQDLYLSELHKENYIKVAFVDTHECSSEHDVWALL